MRTPLLAIIFITACAGSDEPRVEEQTQAASVAHDNFRGTEATARLDTQTLRISIDLVQNESTTYGGETFVFYEYGVADPTSLVCTGYCYYARWTYDDGYGVIPHDDAQITPGNAHLHTSTTVDGFTTTRCTYDQRDGSYTCDTPPSGDIDIAWNRVGLTTDFASGTSRQVSPMSTMQTSGTFWTSSAQASGSVPDHSFDVAYGTLVDTHSGLVMKSFTRNF